VAGIFTLTVNPQFASAASPSPESPSSSRCLRAESFGQSWRRESARIMLRKALCRLLFAGILTRAVACTGEKGASGKKVVAPEGHQEK